jgi:nucleoside-diphosphate-sugar epimerase/glycosyltransferase involved in cell wall biosynthesis
MKEELSLEQKIRHLQGPIFVLGGSGFIGSNVALTLLRFRDDVFVTATRLPSWRLEKIPQDGVKVVDLLIDSNLDELIETVQPRTIVDCVAYGAYSFETDNQLIYETNFLLLSRLLAKLESRKISAYLHAGTSSEYGDNASGPTELATLAPNSHYAVSKAAAASLLHYYGKKKGFPCVNLRLYSVYGPLEDSSRLIPNLVKSGIEGKYPEFVDPNVSRDFVYIDDAVEAFIDIALNFTADDYGSSFNVGTGQKTTIKDCAALAKDIFSIPHDPVFSMPSRHWDLNDWYANIDEVRLRIGWVPRTDFRAGLIKTADWFRQLEDRERYFRSSKRFGLDTKHSVSAVVACYKDNQAIPVMYERLKNTFTKLNIDYEIIFVNDGSPDDSEEVIRKISRNDRKVRGISHSRNFGSQAGFRSGMEISTKNSCVLLDGDLQDPPELIEAMVEKWREGYDVVYGRRVGRQATLFMRTAYKAFYRVFDYFSYVPIPHDAGDFALMDKRVVDAMLRFPERDLFLRGVRAYAGFKQTGIDYLRPKRAFGVTTNSFLKNIAWAKKGIYSFTYVPLDVLSTAAVILLGVTGVLMSAQLLARLFFPELAPRGITTLLMAVLFFGSLNLLAISIVGEYVAKIFEEVKRRPHFIRRSVIKEGEIRFATMNRKQDEES